MNSLRTRGDIYPGRGGHKGWFANGQDAKPWVDREKIGLDEIEAKLGTTMIRDKVAASTDGFRAERTSGQKRFYDGLILNDDGTYTGIDIKSGAGRRNAVQHSFDNSVSRETPARL